jgi:hypothetical protein
LSEVAAFWINRPSAIPLAPDGSNVQELEQDDGGVKRAVMGIVVVRMDDVVPEVAAVEVAILNSGGFQDSPIDALRD